MQWSDFRQFFEGENGALSMTRLLCFLSFFPATWIAVKLGTENAMTIYVGCYAMAYLGGKVGDAMMQKEEDKK